MILESRSLHPPETSSATITETASHSTLAGQAQCNYGWPSDIIIAVMGITGSGKSTFISKLADQKVPVGHGLNSMTATTCLYSFQHPTHGTIYLIDTPGFDDTTVSDTDVLKNIAAFLSATYQQQAKLTGIIYLHRISDNRVAGSSLRNINMFKQLCGEEAYKHVALVTSMWAKEDHDTAVRRESELREQDGFWGLMHARESAVMRWHNDAASASAVLAHLLQRRLRHGPATLRIQRELVDENRPLQDTSAGQTVDRQLAEAKRKWAAELQLLKTEHEQAMKERDQDLAKRLTQQENELKEKLKKADEAQAALIISVEKLQRETMKKNEMKEKRLLEQWQKAKNAIAEQEAKLQRILEARKKDAELYEELRLEHMKEKARLDDRDKNRAKKLAELEASLRKQFEDEARESQRREMEVKAELKKSKGWKHYLSLVLPPLAGVGLVVAGLATGNVALLPSGIAMMFGGALKNT